MACDPEAIDFPKSLVYIIETSKDCNEADRDRVVGDAREAAAAGRSPESIASG